MQLITIHDSRSIMMINPDDIIRIEALSNYSKIFLTNQRPMVVSKVLHWFQDRLPQEMFARVHRSHLINKNFAQQIQGGHHKILLLTNGELIAISRRMGKGLVA